MNAQRSLIPAILSAFLAVAASVDAEIARGGVYERSGT